MAKLIVDSPYHFGWKVKDEREAVVIVPDGTHQEVDLDKQTTDIMLYKGEKAIGWWKIINPSSDLIKYNDGEEATVEYLEVEKNADVHILVAKKSRKRANSSILAIIVDKKARWVVREK